MGPQKIEDSVLLDIWGICIIKNGTLSLLSKSFYTKILFSILMSKSKNEA